MLGGPTGGHRRAASRLARTRAGKPLPLAWSREAFRVRMEDGREPEVRSWIARPFGFYHAGTDGVDFT